MDTLLACPYEKKILNSSSYGLSVFATMARPNQRTSTRTGPQVHIRDVSRVSSNEHELMSSQSRSSAPPAINKVPNPLPMLPTSMSVAHTLPLPRYACFQSACLIAPHARAYASPAADLRVSKHADRSDYASRHHPHHHSSITPPSLLYHSSITRNHSSLLLTNHPYR